MNLLTSWKDSLSFLKPSSFRPFILVTIKSIEIACKSLLRSLWWFFLVVLIVYTIFDFCFLSFSGTIMHMGAWLVTFFCSLLASLFLFLAIRPSIKRKTIAYYREYSGYVLYCMLLVVIVVLVVLISSAIFPYQIDDMLLSLSTIGNPLLPGLITPIFFVSPLVLFIVLFILDSDGMPISFLWSIARGAKMLLYNYPLCYFFYLIFYLWNTFIAKIYYTIVGQLIFSIIPSFWVIIGLLLLNRLLFFAGVLIGSLIPLAFFTNVYIKIVHDHYKLYFE